MKVALSVLPLPNTPVLPQMLEAIQQAAESHCQLLVFPEAVFTGLDLSWDYEIDLRSALTLESPEIVMLTQAQPDGAYICVSVG